MKNLGFIGILVVLGMIISVVPVSSATVSDDLSGPILMYPENGTYTTDHIITLGWFDEEWAQQYFLQVDNNTDFSSPEIETYVVEAQFTTEFPLSDGTYYWRVKAISDKKSKWLWADKAEITIFTVLGIRAPSADLGITAQQQHKDTRMLCLKGCSLTGAHAWDDEHVTRGCLHDNWYCVRAAISMINSYYSGHLSQDRISYYILEERLGAGDGIPENDLGHGKGISSANTKAGLSWALNRVAISNPQGKPAFAQIKTWIDNGQPILRREPVDDHWHATVIDGYDDAGQLVHVIDPWTGAEGTFAYNTVSVVEVWVPPSGAPARSDEVSLTKDTDNDGIVDFDEEMRFKTDINDENTDDDCLPDKIEIQSYTFINDVFDINDVRKPDVDGDGERAELDPDTDDGGVIDGCEDKNANGKVDPGETDPFKKDDDIEGPCPCPTANPVITAIVLGIAGIAFLFMRREQK